MSTLQVPECCDFMNAARTLAVQDETGENIRRIPWGLWASLDI